MPPPEAFAIRALDPEDGVNSLSLGDDPKLRPLKTFLRKHAKPYEQKLLGRTYVLVDKAHATTPGRVWGYVTLVASEVQTTDLTRPKGAHWPDGYHLPAVKLARMAIDAELQGKDYGTQFMDWVLGVVGSQIAGTVGCRLLVTDAKQSAIGFYEKKGFTMLDSPDNRERSEPVMFIDLQKASA